MDTREMVIETLEKLAIIDEDQKPFYTCIKEAINLKAYENSIKSCKDVIQNFNTLNVIRQDIEFSLLTNKVIEYFNSIITMLKLIDVEEEKTKHCNFTPVYFDYYSMINKDEKWDLLSNNVKGIYEQLRDLGKNHGRNMDCSYKHR